MRGLCLFTVLALLLLPTTTGADDGFSRTARFGRIDLSAGIPPDLGRPEGKSRWDLTAVQVGASFLRSLRSAEGRVVEQGAERWLDPYGGDAALRWAFPDRERDALRPGHVDSFAIERRGETGGTRVWIETRIVGIGWVHLPSGPREVVLQRVLVQRQDDTGAYVADRLTHRWIDPRAGVVAEVSGPVSGDGRTRLSIDSASVVEEVLAGAADLTIYVDELDFPRHERVRFGWGRGQVCVDGTNDGDPCSQDSECATTGACGTFVSSLTPEGYANIGQLIDATQWDFTPSTAGCTSAPPDPSCKEIVSTGTSFDTCSVSMTVCESDLDCPAGETCLSAGETCNETSCGYRDPAAPGRKLERSDFNPGSANWVRNNQVSEREQRASDFTVWLRGGTQKEGVSGSFGAGESRFCWVGDAQETRTPVPLWQFQHQDANGWFLQTGDIWEGGPFDCQQTIFNNVCGDNSSGLQRVAACDCPPPPDPCDYRGVQGGEVLKGGVVTLPSGHTVNALLVRTLAEFCVHGNCTCSNLLCFVLARVRTVVYLWQVPGLGTVALLRSQNNAPADLRSFDRVKLADIKVGLFPPVSIAAGATTETTADLSWDPGNDTQRISGYKIYWDTDSGAVSDYAFNSDDNASQVTFAGTSATISGLDDGTEYFFTVTSISEFTNPSTSVTRSYESIRFPTQVSGDPGFVYPIEVQATTACSPSHVPRAEVTGLTARWDGAGIEICWDPLADPCLDGYTILGADSPESDANFTTLAEVGPVTCWTGAPTESYFLVTGRASGGTGPWGHFGR